MRRHLSDSSTGSTSRLKRVGSAIRRMGSVKQHRDAPSPNNVSLPVQNVAQELDATEHEPDSITTAEKLVSQEIENTVKQLLELPAGATSSDIGYTAYARVRERLLMLCKRLIYFLQHARANIFLSMHGARQDKSPKLSSYGHSWKDPRLAAIIGFETYLEKLLLSLRSSLSTTYLAYAPDATAEQLDLLFDDNLFRDSAITQLRTCIPWPEFGSLDHWDQYTKQFRNYDRTKDDLSLVQRHHDVAKSHVDRLWDFDYGISRRHLATSRYLDAEGPVVRDIVIAAKGDTLLSFASTVPETLQVLRFLVSSHMLIEVSPYFAKLLSCPYEEDETSKMLLSKPLQPDNEVWNDGSIVKVYDMPQDEHNKFDSLTILLHAAHMHNDKIPRQILYHEFISIAETCLRYQCTSPLEMAVEHRWLPQWLHKVNDEYPDAMLLISYVFGLRQIFRRTSKSVILNVQEREELLERSILPPEVSGKIETIRATKLAQIYAACAEALQEYYRSGAKMSRGTDGAVAGWELSLNAKCLRGSHQCDATNLGWLLLVFGELGILANVTNTVYGKSWPPPPRCSIQSLVDGIRKMPSAEQIHDSACDHVPALRASMNDIYNSITGLTFWDVCGKGGWALSRDHDTTTGITNEMGVEVFELPAPGVSQLVASSRTPASPRTLQKAVVALRIMYFLDDLEDIHATAMLNKAFYAVYKENELGLIKSAIAATSKKLLRKYVTLRPSDVNKNSSSSSLIYSFSADSNNLSALCNDRAFTPPSPSSSVSTADASISTDEVQEILWPQDVVPQKNEQRHVGEAEHDQNQKYRIDGGQLCKSLVIEEKKYTQQESDEHLRRGSQSAQSSRI